MVEKGGQTVVIDCQSPAVTVQAGGSKAGAEGVH